MRHRAMRSLAGQAISYVTLRWQNMCAAQAGTVFLWTPVFLIFGIWAYFALPREPNLVDGAVLACVATLLLWRWRHKAVVSLLALFCCGFLLAQMRTYFVETPLLVRPTPKLMLTGVVADMKFSASGERMMIFAPESIEGFTAQDMPRYLRLTVAQDDSMLAVGKRISMQARLLPLQGPVSPGGYDYGRQLFFQSIGGTGRVTSAITITGEEQGPELWVMARVAALRDVMSGRITAQLAGVAGAMGDALITGNRANISKEVNKDLQVSGLAHILSISGLHMTLAAGGVFWTLRALLALIPAIAQHVPVKKWAAFFAIIFGFIYMLMAAGGAATQRSFIMIAIMFFAVMVDRPAISMRNLALAAIIILVIEPESATDASFQMSFMAVMGLAAFFEMWRNRPQHKVPLSFSAKLRTASLSFIVISVATTLVAGTLSSIPAAYHFGRLSPYGVLANGLAIPVISFVIMPAALISVVLMPVGLEQVPLWVMGKGLDVVVAIAHWVAGLPGAQNLVPQLPVFAAILLGGACLLVCLGRGALRFAAIPLVIVSSMLVVQKQPPDILIEKTAANIAYRNEFGALIPARANKANFAIEKWLQSNGEDVAPDVAGQRDGWFCDEALCETIEKGHRISYLFNEKMPPDDCSGMEIVIASYPLRQTCLGVALRIDRFDVWKNGAYALWFDGDAVKVATAADVIGERPWRVVLQPRARAIAKADAGV